MRHIVVAVIAFTSVLPATAQVQPPTPVRVPDYEKPTQPFIWSSRRLLTAPELFDAPDEWIDRSLQWVNYILETYPPSLPEHPIRRAALIRLDDILHLESAPRKELIQKYYRDRMERVIQDIERTKVTSGMRIWKLYNHGFLVRTPTVSFTFDVVPGIRVAGFAIPNELIERLAAQSDATFISHLHGDHANQDVARVFLKHQKPVVAPEGLWKDVPDLASRLTYPKRATDAVERLSIQGGKQTLTVIAFPGHQGSSVLNNVHMVKSTEGFTVIQTGDQSGDDKPGSDFDWLSNISRSHKVDVLFPNVWTNGLDRIVRGISPAVVITGHENEMAHTVDHREDYTQSYTRLYDIPYPALIMTWGESWHYRPASKR